MEYPFELSRNGRTIRGFVTIGYSGRFWIIRDVFVNIKGGHRRAQARTESAVKKHLYKYRALDIYTNWARHRGKDIPQFVASYVEARG